MSDKPKLFAVQATLCHEKNGWRSMHQVPTFYLDADIHGLRTEEEAEKLAERMLRGIAGEGAVVGIGVCAVEV